MAQQNVGKELCHLGGWENKGSNSFSQHIFASVCVYSFPGMSQETEQFGGICRYLALKGARWRNVLESKLAIPHSHTAQFRSLPGVGLLGQLRVKHSGLPCPCAYCAPVFFGRFFFLDFSLAMTCENESSQSSHESRYKILEQISLQH